jgi:hypothetical protein
VEVAQAVVDAQTELDFVSVNAAYLASERSWTEDETAEYYRRWALSPEARARKAAQFAMHPVFGLYVPTYAYGYRLAHAYAESRSDGFRSLLNEQLTTADLLEGAVPVV